MKCKILIIDDNEQDQKLIRKLIEREGIADVITAETGVDGIFVAEKERPEIILLDTQLPGIDGFETCKRLKSIKGYDPKVVIITGVIEAVDAKQARESGSDNYCAKTRDCAKLMLAVKMLIEEL